MPLSPHVTQACQGVIHILQWWCPSCHCPLMGHRHARGSFTYYSGGVLHAAVLSCDTGMLGGHSHITVVVSFMPLSPHATQACQGVIHILHWWCPSCHCPLMRHRHARGSFTYYSGGVLYAAVSSCDTGMLGGQSHITVVCPSCRSSLMQHRHARGSFIYYSGIVLHATVPSCDTGMLGGHSYITVVVSFMPLSPHATQACQWVIHILQWCCP